MPLHIDYRPQELKQIIGNKSAVESLEAILNRKTDFPHAMLFTGPSGTGKTTLARIVAAQLGINNMDLRELNIADLRGIDNARDIQEQMRLRPLSGNCRGWILDEVHQATKDFQNAMLKALEDTPKHVYFFLCTTDPAKLLPTIKNRCHEFKTELLSPRDLLLLITEICNKEKVDVPQEVQNQIIQDAQGSARAALVILDKIIDMEPNAMLEAAKQTAAEQNATIDLCRALINIRTTKEWPTIAKILSGLGDYDPENVRQAVIGYCNAILLKEDNSKAWVVLDAFRDPFDRNGRPGVTWACYLAMNANVAGKF